MNESLKLILVNTLYLLAMINPISKVAVLSVTSTTSDPVQFRSVIQKSSIVAGLILLGTMIFGSFILKSVFHVELQALQIAGGSVLFIAGYNALRKGVFFESEAQKRLEDVALVPLACPMIAGPATIASSIALRTHYGLWLAGLSLI
ncbi:MAG: MarC family protein, partial [Kiritimatiellia bacterium]|nr:MarC family protein [Kiritimatiellia bacterium]